MSKSDNENKPHLPGIRQSGHDAEEGRYLAEALIDAAREGMLVLSPDLTVQSANTSFYSMFLVGEAETKGKLIYELGNGQWNIPELRRLLEQVLPHNSVMNGFEVTHTFEELGERTMLLNASRVEHLKLIVLAIEDITARRQAEEALEHLNKTLEQRVAERTRTVRRLAAELTLTESRERHRIAQLLHDELQQQLHGAQFALHDALNPPAPIRFGSERGAAARGLRPVTFCDCDVPRTHHRPQPHSAQARRAHRSAALARYSNAGAARPTGEPEGG